MSLVNTILVALGLAKKVVDEVEEARERPPLAPAVKVDKPKSLDEIRRERRR